MEAKLLLQHLILDEKLFTMDHLNQKLLEFDLGYMEVKTGHLKYQGMSWDHQIIHFARMVRVNFVNKLSILHRVL